MALFEHYSRDREDILGSDVATRALSVIAVENDFVEGVYEKLRNVRLIEMDAADLKFLDGTFDIVYAPYLISVVPDPIAVAREMRRVCRTGGRLIFMNHFRSPNPLLGWIERVISPFTVHIGFKSDLDLPAFVAQAELNPLSIEKVNIPRIWSLVTCVKA
jgi:phosphatidylethanolamine/phosphatidyl-N-methylethanolamine N-methyltransferase